MFHERPLRNVSENVRVYDFDPDPIPPAIGKRKSKTSSECSTHKQSRFTSGDKENHNQEFVLGRRSKKKRCTIDVPCWDSLPDEIVLRILFCLPLPELLKTSQVCKRWHRLAFDESIWQSVDLEGVMPLDACLGQLLTPAVRTLRCPRACLNQPRFTYTGPLRVKFMDLSYCTVTPAVLQDVLSRCTQLLKLSLEGLELSDDIMLSLAKNPSLEELNLCGCSGFSPASLGRMLKSCSRLCELNLSWCKFGSHHVKVAVCNIPSNVSHLNFSGYREKLVMEDVKTLLERCCLLKTLDLSDSVHLTTDCFPMLQSLEHLTDLSLSRCYNIHPAALADLETFPSLTWLQVFGLADETSFTNILEGLKTKGIHINNRPFSSVARPSPGGQNDHKIWNQKCRLRYKC